MCDIINNMNACGIKEYHNIEFLHKIKDVSPLQTCIERAKEKEHEMIIRYNPSDKKNYYASFKTRRQFLSFMNSLKSEFLTFNEVLTGPCRLTFDMESMECYYMKANKAVPYILNNLVILVGRVFFKLGWAFDKNSFRFTNSTGMTDKGVKISLHATYNDKGFKNIVEQKRFIDYLNI